MPPSRICAAIVCAFSIGSARRWTGLRISRRSKAERRSRMSKWVYSFGAGLNEGRADMRDLLGGKGANLAEMASIGLPVPPGFTITTEVCTAFYKNDRQYPSDLVAQVRAALGQIERAVNRRFGDARQPLLVSVRSGARVSMPGMMDTVLNLGLNDATVDGLARQADDERFAWGAYRRFVQMYADVVLGVRAESELEQDPFGAQLERLKKKRGAARDCDLAAADLRALVKEYKAIVRARTGRAFPEDPHAQLWGAIRAV